MMKFPKPSNIAYEADILEKVTKELLEVNHWQAKVTRVVVAGMLNDGMAHKSQVIYASHHVPVGENHVATAKVRRMTVRKLSIT